MDARKNIALVAHDNRKKDMIEWVEWNVTILLQHRLTCTGTTGRLVEKAIRSKEKMTALEKRWPRKSERSAKWINCSPTAWATPMDWSIR